MTKTSTHPRRCAGIDVGKTWLDIARSDKGQAWREPNTAAGHQTLVTTLKSQGVTRVGVEATGHYEAAVVHALRDAGLEVVVFQPRQVKAYGMFKLKRAKSDRIDAQLIAQCTAALDTVKPAPDPRIEALAEQLTRIEQIEEDLARAKIRRERFTDPRCLAQLDSDIVRLQQHRNAERKRLCKVVCAYADLARRMALLRSIPGLGERTALALVIRMPELGTLSREQAAALVGVAPFIHDSGRRSGERHVGGGRARLRTTLFAATQAAARQWNTALIAFYDRLVAAGKPHGLAIVACSRKLVINANTVLAQDRPWITAR